MEFPRILIINGEPLSTMTASGITMRNLFGDWPPDALATIHASNLHPDFTHCRKVWRLKKFDVCGYSSGGIQKIEISTEALRTMRGVPRNSWKRVISREITSMLDCLPYSLTPALRRWIDAFAPEAIYTMGANIRIMKLCNQVARQYGIPIIPHFMDNWPATAYMAQYEIIQRFLLERQLNRLLSNSPVCFTISPEMSVDYSRKWQKPCRNFMNCTELQKYSEPMNASCNSLQLFYIGGLHLNRWTVLKEVADIIGKQTELSSRFSLTIFAPQKDWLLFGDTLKASGITFGGELTEQEIFPKMQAGDILLHVESSDQKNTNYTRLSISTKLVQYFMAGRAILGIGPENLASMCEIRRSEGGTTIQNMQELPKVLMQFLKDEDRHILGIKAYQYAIRTHAAPIVRDHFRQTIFKMINSGK